MWATGPGGVHVYNARKQEIGFISTGVKTGNVAFSNSHVYIMANHDILRIPLSYNPRS